MRKKQVSAVKTVICTHCDGESEVAQRAMSVFCPHCRKRLILENYKIKEYRGVRELFTCGDVVVEKKGHVCASIKAGNLTIKGNVQGDVRARGCVKIIKTGIVRGDVTACSLTVESGAVVQGFLKIEGAQAAKNPDNGAPVVAAH